MTDEPKIPPSKISYYKNTESLDHGIHGKSETISLSVESQTNRGALLLFRKLRKET